MKQLKRQGFFREMLHGEATDPSIKEYINKLTCNSEEKSKIIDYLHDGILLTACCGTSDDIIHPENGVAGVPSFYTDGKWVWPGDLVYYVNRYNLALDLVFLEDMRANQWKVPKKSIDSDEFTIV